MRLSTAASLVATALTAHTAVNLRLLRTPDLLPDRSGSRERVSVLLPARDEAARIRPCLEALLAQRGVDVELLVLDDGSTDGTAEVVRTVIAGDPRARLLTGRPPPPGWLGKPHACRQLADAATGDVLVFVDADVVCAPTAVAAAVALLHGGGLDLVCPYPRQVADGPAARLVQPLLQWSWLTFLPLRLAERAASPLLVAANGQLLCCDREAYRTAGGHHAVAAAVLDDVELARAFKRAGLRPAMADGTSLAVCRMYEGWAELRDGYTKSLWAAFGSPAGAVAVLALLCWLYLVPPLAAARALAGRRPARAGLPLLGYAAGITGRVLVARRTGGRPGDAAAHPGSILLLAWLTADSWRRRTAGRLRWRGRPLPAGPPRRG